jgi:D-aspartate ligase
LFGIAGRPEPEASPSTSVWPRPAAVVCGDLNLLRCFAGHDVSTIVAAWHPAEATLRSRYCRERALIAPPEEPERALADLEELGKRQPDRPVLYYGCDKLLLLVSRHRERLQRWYRFRMPSEERIEQLVDKIAFAKLAAARNLHVPETVASEEVGSVAELARSIPLPCVLKPANHTGWFASRPGMPPEKAIRATDIGELRAAYEELSRHAGRFVAQRWVHGGEDRIYSYHAYVGEGLEPLGHFVGKKIRTYPRRAGVSTFLELVKDPEVAELGAYVVKQLAIEGPVKVDFKRDASSGRLYLLEVNPRFTLWNYLGAVCGVNLPRLAYGDLVGAPRSAMDDYRTGVRWLSLGNDLRACMREYLPAGDLNLASWMRSYWAPTVFDVFSWRDPAPWSSAAAQYARALIDRTVFARMR